MTDFFRQINLRNQKFKCYKAGDKNESLDLTVDIHNELNSGATDDEILLLKTLIPDDNQEIIDFYKLHNGLDLYCNGEVCGLKISPIDDLKELNEDWKEWFSDYEDDELYDFQKGGFAFGEIAHSGNYFVFYEGKVFYSDHDEFEEKDLGNTFNEFLQKTVTDPAEFLYDMGCYTRYSDGKTDGQWIPKQFIADEN